MNEDHSMVYYRGNIYGGINGSGGQVEQGAGNIGGG